MGALLKGLSDWISAASVAADLQRFGWVVPTVQTIHILAIAGVTAPALVINLRLAGVAATGMPLEVIASRFTRWIWIALGVLFLSGSMLVFIEPERPLSNPFFFLKMVMVIAAALLSLAFSIPLRRDPSYWDAPRRKYVGSSLAVLSTLLWLGVICAGRWIAYTTSL